MSKQHVSIRLTDFHGGFLSFSWPSISLSEAGEESRRSIDVFSFDSEDSVVGDCIGIINVDPGILQEPTWLDAIHAIRAAYGEVEGKSCVDGWFTSFHRRGEPPHRLMPGASRPT